MKMELEARAHRSGIILENSPVRMKCAAILAALIGSSAITALEPRLWKPATGMSEVIMTRTVTVTTFQQAESTDGNILKYRDVQSTKGSARKGVPRNHTPAGSPDRMSSSQGVTEEIQGLVKEAIDARATIPTVVMPTVLSKIWTLVARSEKHGHAAPGLAAPMSQKPGVKPS